MKPLVFVLAVAAGLLIFGLPVLACITALLAVGLGLAVETSFSCGIFLTLAFIIGIAIKVFFLDE